MTITKMLLTATALSWTFTLAHADIIEVWNCKLLDGKTSSDLQAASSAWLAAAKQLPGNKKIEVWHNYPVVANTPSRSFSFVTITTDIKAWGTAGQAYPGSAVEKADQAWTDVASCSGNSLWYSEQVK